MNTIHEEVTLRLQEAREMKRLTILRHAVEMAKIDARIDALIDAQDIAKTREKTP